MDLYSTFDTEVFEQEIPDALSFRPLLDLADVPQPAQGTEYHECQPPTL